MCNGLCELMWPRIKSQPYFLKWMSNYIFLGLTQNAQRPSVTMVWNPVFIWNNEFIRETFEKTVNDKQCYCKSNTRVQWPLWTYMTEIFLPKIEFLPSKMIKAPSVYDSGALRTILLSLAVFDLKKASNQAEWWWEHPNHIQRELLSSLTPYENLIFVQKFWLR